MRLRCVSLAMERAADHALANFTRQLGILRGIGMTAPMVGALGTSFAIVDSFPDGGGERYAIYFAFMSRLSDAIAPVALGILLALLNYLVYRYFLTQVDSFRTELLESEDQVPCLLRAGL